MNHPRDLAGALLEHDGGSGYAIRLPACYHPFVEELIEEGYSVDQLINKMVDILFALYQKRDETPGGLTRAIAHMRHIAEGQLLAD